MISMNKEPVVATGFEAAVCKTWVRWGLLDATYFCFEQVVLTSPYETMLGVTEVPLVEFDLSRMEVKFFLSDSEDVAAVVKNLQLLVL